MSIGIVVVCLTTFKPTAAKCQLNFTSNVSNPIEYQSTPRSVAVGHFNNDTSLDFAVVNQATDNVVVFLGFGNGSFHAPVKYSTGSGSIPQMVTAGDFNNDDRLDIAVGNFRTNNIGIFLGLGDGSFAQPIFSSTGASRSLSIYTADLNNDTLLDVVTTNYGTESISLFFGQGNGSLSLPIMYSTGYDSLPMSVVAGDLNNDKYLDLIVAHYGTDSVGVFLQSSDHTFQDQQIFPGALGSRPHSVAVGDFDNDAWLDIAVAEYGTNQISVLVNHGNATFATPVPYSTDTSAPYAIAVGDLNNDHRLDLVVTSRGYDTIAVFIGHGDSTFEKAKTYHTGSKSSVSVAMGDFNNDNRLDVAVVNNDTNNIDVLLGSDIGFPKQTPYTAGAHPDTIAIGDVNGDDLLDIIVLSYFDKNVGVLF